MEKFLIVKCVFLDDEYNNYDKIPLTMCDDWQEWQKENKSKIKYDFEVYRFRYNHFEFVRYCEYYEGREVICYAK